MAPAGLPDIGLTMQNEIHYSFSSEKLISQLRGIPHRILAHCVTNTTLALLLSLSRGSAQATTNDTGNCYITL